MSKEIKGTKKVTYYIAYNLDEKIFHFGEIKKGGVLTTGQPELEEFSTKTEFKKRLDELTGEKDYYYNKTKKQEPRLNKSKLEK
jgi:hypothetical protein